jgi:hypothetical protein
MPGIFNETVKKKKVGTLAQKEQNPNLILGQLTTNISYCALEEYA